MAFVCPEKSERRQSLLSKLKDLVNNIDGNGPAPCPAAPCCSPCVPCGPGPVIEIYDPLPKPCLPICSPGAPCCAPAPCAPACCPPACCAPGCLPPCCPPPSTTVPVPLVPACVAPCVPPCLPICTPCPPPCVPLANPCPEPQPCVPCNPPQMMVCYKLPRGNGLRESKSRELRASILYITCNCIKRNGLQDDCPRSECQGAPACLTKPEPSCGPSVAARRHANGISSKKNGLEEYQCYPAYVKLPGGPSPCCPPVVPGCPPCVPLVAAPPCPPPIVPCCPPLLPIGNVMPVCQSPCCPC